MLLLGGQLPDPEHDDRESMDLEDVDKLLVSFLDAQRSRALEIVEGLDDDLLVKPALPSGWTPLGMIQHLGYAERHWFQRVATGSAGPLPWAPNPDDEDGPFTTDRSAEEVFAFYSDQIDRANAFLAVTPLSTPPLGQHIPGRANKSTDLRMIVLHMIEETARHLGHLDAARELLDGRAGLGQDNV